MAYKIRQSYLQSRGPVYYFRIVVPKTLLPVFGKREYKKSLKTGEYGRARHMCAKYGLFVERYFELVERMQPTRDDINKVIRNHFEKCLMDAEMANWWIYDDLESSGDDIADIIGQEKVEYQALLKLAQSKQYGPQQIHTAKKLLNWRGLVNFKKPYCSRCKGNGGCMSRFTSHRFHHLATSPVQCGSAYRGRNQRISSGRNRIMVR